MSECTSKCLTLEKAIMLLNYGNKSGSIFQEKGIRFPNPPQAKASFPFSQPTITSSIRKIYAKMVIL